jgi:hypothetical protein
VGYFDPLLSLIISYTPLILLRKRLGNVWIHTLSTTNICRPLNIKH